jgi:AcrR family transcriptional regulator
VFESNNVRIEEAPTASPKAGKAPTRWGDREQRRRDILAAARERIASGGYLSLNMRDLAAGAGISPATLYSYFATKEELFATLYAEAIRTHTATFRPVAEAGHDLATLLGHVIRQHLNLYRLYGRHFTLWSTMRRSPSPSPTGPGSPAASTAASTTAKGTFPRELIDELRTVTREHNHLLMESVRQAAARDGRRVVDERLVPSFLWSALNGLADHFTSERRALDGFPPERLVDFSAARLAVAVTEPATPADPADPGDPADPVGEADAGTPSRSGEL